VENNTPRWVFVSIILGKQCHYAGKSNILDYVVGVTRLLWLRLKVSISLLLRC